MRPVPELVRFVNISKILVSRKPINGDTKVGEDVLRRTRRWGNQINGSSAVRDCRSRTPESHLRGVCPSRIKFWIFGLRYLFIRIKIAKF
jgi:hypothetical protein